MLFDAHRHLDPRRTDLVAELAGLRRRRTLTFAASMDPDEHAMVRALAADEPLVISAPGVHPARATAWAQRADELRAALVDAPFVGVAGLDADAQDAAAQRAVLDVLLQHAAQRDVLAQVTARGADDDLLRALRRHGVRRVVVHAYRGPVRTFRRLVDFGAWFTIADGVRTEPVDRSIAAEIPDDRVLVATGSGVGEPLLLRDIQRAAADARGVSPGVLQALVRANVERLIEGDDCLSAWCDRARESSG